jgi:hypothetical protein
VKVGIGHEGPLKKNGTLVDDLVGVWEATVFR